MATTTTATTTLNVVSLPVSLAPATGNFSGPACIILNTTGATLSQMQQQHPQLLVNPRNEKDYQQHHHLHYQQQQCDQNSLHNRNNNNNTNNSNNQNNNNNIITKIGNTTNNGTVVGVVGVGELVGLVGVGGPVVNVSSCSTSSAPAVGTNVLAPLTPDTSTAAVALRLNGEPPVTLPAVLRPVNAPAPITTNVTTSNVILNVNGILNKNNSTNTTLNNININNNNNNHIKSHNNIINNNNNKSISNNSISNININNNTNTDNILINNNNNKYNNVNPINNNNTKKMKINISKMALNNGMNDPASQQLLSALQQPYQQHQTQHQPELLRCKRRIDFSGLGFTLPRTQPAAVARRNERERNRVKLVNLGFEALREHVPNGRKNKKMSKVETLRAAVQYIKQLQELLHNEPDFLDLSDFEMCAAAAAAAAAAQFSSTSDVSDAKVPTSMSAKSPNPNSDISCSPSSSLYSDSGSSCDPFNEDDLIDFSRLL